MAKKKAADEDADRNRIRRLLDNCEIEDVRLQRSMCSHFLREGKLPDNLETVIQSEGRYVPESEMLVLIHSISLEGKYDDDKETDRPPFQIGATFTAGYTVKGEHSLTHRHIASFAKAVSMFHVWPYWREYVQSTTCRMGLPSLTVQLYKLSDLAKGAISTVAATQAAKKKAASKKRPSRKKSR